MLNGLLNLLQGQIHIRAECAFPERILNLCSIHDLAFWDLKWENETTFTCRISRQDFRRLRQAAEKLDCTLSVMGREGVPFFLLRFRHRQALLVGLVGCSLALFLGSFFIWEFRIEGNERVPEETILRALEKNDVNLGTFGLLLDGEQLRNEILLEIPELSWIAINVSGCCANVQVRERLAPPELVDEQTPANVVARQPGLVLKVRAMDGVASVLPGMAVTEGQLLISGVEDTEPFGARIFAGMGSVEARTWHALTTRIPMTMQEKRATGSKKTAISLLIGKRRVKFFANSSIEDRKYDKIRKNYQTSVLGIPLPIKVVVETYRFYEPETVQIEAVQAEQLGEAVLQEQLQQMVEPYGTISSTRCTSRQLGNTLEVTLSAECVEEIGIRVPILRE